MLISEALRAISLYPMNPLTIANIAEECGLVPSETLDAETRSSSAFKKAQAKVYQYLAESPSVSQAGATYNFTEADRDAFRRKAGVLLEEAGVDSEQGFEVGYFGEDF